MLELAVLLNLIDHNFMKYRHAEINDDGAQALLLLGESPAKLDCDPEMLRGKIMLQNQLYLPGISIPDDEILSTHFCVPLLGDTESISITVDWSHKPEAPYHKRVSFFGMLSAEYIFDTPPDCNLGADEDENINDAYDDFAEFGGFLHATVEVIPVAYSAIYTHKARAAFYLLEDEGEHGKINSLLEHGDVSASELVLLFSFMGDLKALV